MQFKSRDVLDTFPHFTGPDHGQLDDVTLKPFGIGAGTPWKPTTMLRRTLKLPFQFHTRAEWRQFRDRIAAHRGRLQGFWLPIWLTDYPSTSQAAGQNLINMTPVGLQGVFAAGNQFAFCALIKSGLVEPHEIASIATVAGQDQLTLTSNIVGTFPTTPGGAILCGMLFARVDDQEIEYDFISDGVIECTVNFSELPKEYGADIQITTPVYLFEISRGFDTWRTTNFGRSLVMNGELYISDNIEVSEKRSSTDFLSESLKISVGIDRQDHPLLFHILNRRAFETTSVVIYRVDASATTFDNTKLYYSGVIDPASGNKDGEIELEISSIFRIGETSVPRPQVQRFCNLRNGDANCGVDKSAFTTAGFITAIQTDDPPYIEASEFGAAATANSDPNWFALGTVTVNSEIRICTGQNGNRLYLDYGFYSANIGDEADAVAGDDKRAATCKNKFNNLPNHLAFTYLPNENPQVAPGMNPDPGGGKKG